MYTCHRLPFTCYHAHLIGTAGRVYREGGVEGGHCWGSYDGAVGTLDNAVAATQDVGRIERCQPSLCKAGAILPTLKLTMYHLGQTPESVIKLLTA